MNGISILVVDDEPAIRDLLNEVLTMDEYEVHTAEDGLAGVQTFRAVRPQVVLLDVQMPEMNGLYTLRKIRDEDPLAQVIMVTSEDETETVRRALTIGAYDYLLKPLHIPGIRETIRRAIAHRDLAVEVEEYRKHLETLVADRTRELASALRRIESTYDQTILALGSALETRDVETQTHSLRVAGFTRRILMELGITSETDLAVYERGAILHDIGKIGVPDAILLKPGSLTDEEWTVMKKHPTIGASLLGPIEFLRPSVAIVLHHHERWDGRGYPSGLQGSAIPLEARAFSIADTLDAITSDRPYRKGQPLKKARKIISEESGIQFDPNAVRAFERIPDETLRDIRTKASSGG